MPVNIFHFIFATMLLLLTVIISISIDAKTLELEVALKNAEENKPYALKYLLENYNQEQHIQLFEKHAKEGSMAAQNWLADKYMAGEIIQHKIPNAVQLYSSAADQGFAPSQYRLYILYNSGAWGYDGKGVYKDKNKAKKYLDMAVKAGYAKATQLSSPQQFVVKNTEINKKEVWHIKAASERDDFMELEDLSQYILKNKNDCQAGRFTETSCLCELKPVGKKLQTVLKNATERNPNWNNKILKFETEYISKYGLSRKRASSELGVYVNLVKKFESKWCFKNETKN